MLVFIDTEFTGFNSPDLISIGMVDESGELTLYIECSDYDKQKVTQFVKDNVVPLLGRYDGTRCLTSDVGNHVLRWLEQFKAEGVILAYDYEGDLTLVKSLFGGALPSWISSVHIWDDINDIVLATFYKESGLPQHHALFDALANRFSYRPKSSSN